MTRLTFATTIGVPKELVWAHDAGRETYRQRTLAFEES
jgi:hypothetical protein